MLDREHSCFSFMSPVVAVRHLLSSSVLNLILYSNIGCLFLVEEDHLVSLAQIWPIKSQHLSERGRCESTQTVHLRPPTSCLQSAHSGYDMTREAWRLGCVCTRISQPVSPTKICGGVKQ